MSKPNDPGTFWDEMYDREDYRYGLEPNAWVRAAAPRIKPGGRVLSIGDGEGRNGVWLAGQGFEVTTIDASKVGVSKAQQLAQKRGVHMDAYHGRFPDGLPAELRDFDAIVLTFIHIPSERRAGFHQLVIDRLAPGGKIVLEGFTKEQLGRSSGGPQNLEMLFEASELAADFGSLEIETLETHESELIEGDGHRGLAALVRLLATKKG